MSENPSRQRATAPAITRVLIAVVIAGAVVLSACTPDSHQDEGASGGLYPAELVSDVEKMRDPETGLVRAPTGPSDPGADSLYATAYASRIAERAGRSAADVPDEVLGAACRDAELPPLHRTAMAAWVTGPTVPRPCAASEADFAPPSTSGAVPADADRWLVGVHMVLSADVELPTDVDGEALAGDIKALADRESSSAYRQWLVAESVRALDERGADVETESREPERPPMELANPTVLLDWLGYVALQRGDCDCDGLQEAVQELLSQQPDLFVADVSLSILQRSSGSIDTSTEAEAYLQASGTAVDGGEMLALPQSTLGSVDITYDIARLLGKEGFSRVADERTVESAERVLSSMPSAGLYERLVVDTIRTYTGDPPQVEHADREIREFFEVTDCGKSFRSCFAMANVANALDHGPAAQFTVPESVLAHEDAELAVMRAYTLPDNISGVRVVDEQHSDVRSRLVDIATDDADPLNALAAAGIAGAGLQPEPETLDAIEAAVGSRMGCAASDHLIRGPEGGCDVRATLDALRAGIPLAGDHR